MERDSFIFYRSFYEAVACLDDEDRLACLDAICEYALNGTMPEESPVAAAILMMAKPTIDKNNERYSNGKRGGRPSANRQETTMEPTGNHTETKTEPKRIKGKPDVDVDVDVDVDKKKKREAHPTVEEVRAYCAERGNKVNPEAFVDYYDANGWKVGKNPMKDWKACVRRWETIEKERKVRPVKSSRFGHEDRHEYDFDELAGILSRPVGGAV